MSLRSMTGFAAASVAGLDGELRSVNGRGLDLRIRLPEGWGALERRVAGRLRAAAARGQISITIRSNDESESVDLSHVRARQAVWQEVSAAMGRNEVAPMTWLLTGASSGRAAPDEAALDGLLDQLIPAWDQDRCREGSELAPQLLDLVAALRSDLAAIEPLEAQALSAFQERLLERVQNLMGDHAHDPLRLVQEVAVVADRRDISEERVRIGAHLDAAEQQLRSGGPVGRSLGFLAQELLREVNTTGSKSHDLAIAERVLAMKSNVERLREQVLNLE